VVDAATATVVSTLRVGPKPFVLNDGFGDVWSGSYGGHDVWRLRPPRIVTFPLAEHDGSGRSGTARLIAVSAKRTLVTVVLPGTPSDGLPVHLHGGRCGTFTASTLPAHTLRRGRAAFAVALPIKQLANGRFALDVHAGPGAAGYLACANLG
jgi:hypothetical protein